ncbi:MAG TPA: pyruvate carboxylase subunit B, partial [Deltaproteobacteria bacterium]|nr:pyruvate carboxylase subunit B [Deltaproteobacteria bacterium]
GHQSLFATRARTEDLLPVAHAMDEVGFYSMEVWGGATFDTMHRYLAEDPWERIRTLKKHITKTPLSMLLRGQNLVGYRNYPDDVTRTFVERACENGIDIFRVFDALNDFRNFETAVEVIKHHGKHFQGTICYSLTEPRMGGHVYNLDYYLSKASKLEDMGADTICIKDMAGLISPYDAFALVSALKQRVSPPIHLHSHFTSGMADLSLLKAIEAGVDIVDTCLSPWAYRTSHPAIEPLVATLQHTNRDTGFDLEALALISEHLEKITPKYRHLLDERVSIIDINVLLHQTPGGMISNLVNQLKEMDAIDRLEEVFRQLPIVRKELGEVPLVTPTSQIVGIQTVNNVLFDTPEERYKMITAQVKDLCYGLYGKTSVPIDPEVRKKALQDYPRGDTPITTRPADVLEPELEKARSDTQDLARDMDDVLIYALYPTTGKRFLKWKYGHEEIPEEARPKTMDQVQAEEELVKKARSGLLEERPKKKEFPKGSTLSTFRVYIDGDSFEVALEQTGGVPLVAPSRAGSGFQPTFKRASSGRPVQTMAAPRGVNSAPAEPEAAPVSRPEESSKTKDIARVAIVAPMPGMVIRYEVEAGSPVNEGDLVVVLEAMKMENFITSPATGVVGELCCSEGQSVKKGDVLAIIV